MTPPARRLWLYPLGAVDLEIVILGPPILIAPFVVRLRSIVEAWPGFENVQPITMGEQLIGFRVTRSRVAERYDPVAEAMLALHELPLEWTGAGRGMVGT